jgi:hypothetical protein
MRSSTGHRITPAKAGDRSLCQTRGGAAMRVDIGRSFNNDSYLIVII